MPCASAHPGEEMIVALKKAAAALRDAEVPFALSGGFALWARGGPASEHDVDMVIKEEDAERALEALRSAGMATERPPEGWLVKGWHDGVLIDLIYRPSGYVVDGDVLGSAEELSVAGMPMPVMPATEVLVSKLCALDERSLDFEGLLETIRSLREQIDWDRLRRCTAGSPYARALIYLLVELEIAPPK